MKILCLLQLGVVKLQRENELKFASGSLCWSTFTDYVFFMGTNQLLFDCRVNVNPLPWLKPAIFRRQWNSHCIWICVGEKMEENNILYTPFVFAGSWEFSIVAKLTNILLAFKRSTGSLRFVFTSVSSVYTTCLFDLTKPLLHSQLIHLFPSLILWLIRTRLHTLWKTCFMCPSLSG